MIDLDWPDEFDRTDPDDREPKNRYGSSLQESIDDLETTFDRLGVESWELSTGARQQTRARKPRHSDDSPDDPAAVVRWTIDGQRFAVACDAYTRLRDNVRTLYLYVDEKRKMEQRPVETVFAEFTNARLRSGTDDTLVLDEPPHEVLGVNPDADSATVREAFRQQVRVAHPDHGGTEDEFQRVKDAREAMLDV